MKRSVLVSFIMLCTVNVGCVSLGTFQQASTLGQGNVQVAVEPSFYGAGSTSTGPVGLPILNASVAVGLSDNVDLNARLGLSGLDVGGKVMLSSHDAPVLISVAPQVGGFFGGTAQGGGGFLNLQLPVLFGFQTGGGSHFVLGPRVHDILVFGSAGGQSANANVLSLGTSVGYYWRINDGFALLPEVTVLYPIFGAAGGSSGGNSVSGPGSGLFYQAGLALKFGGGRQPSTTSGQ